MKPEQKKAFTLIELVLTIAIVVMLAAAMLPIVRLSIEDAKVAKVLELIDTLKVACQNHYFDTGKYAREYTAMNRPIDHTLFMDPGYSGWNGPYIVALLAAEDNPYGGILYLATAFPVYGFDLDGDGARDKAGDGNMVDVRRISEGAARKINDKFDADVPGDWKVTGKVRYLVYSNGDSSMSVYLIGGT